MIDTHCHLFSEYYDNIEEVIDNMKNNIIIVSGTNDQDNLEVLNLCKKYSNVSFVDGYTLVPHDNEYYFDKFRYLYLNFPTIPLLEFVASNVLHLGLINQSEHNYYPIPFFPKLFLN